MDIKLRVLIYRLGEWNENMIFNLHRFRFGLVIFVDFLFVCYYFWCLSSIFMASICKVIASVTLPIKPQVRLLVGRSVGLSSIVSLLFISKQNGYRNVFSRSTLPIQVLFIFECIIYKDATHTKTKFPSSIKKKL